ncbi:MAG: 1-deoxy-D-xylulose-5-phosphate synthase, partial [Rickettsiales bacterium]|nr:1-deoxy-D-xylulose-5-phosphate synthase [Rickettsiales bacterium]
IVMCPSDEAELALMLKTSLSIENAPSAVRFPRGEAVGVKIPKELDALPIGKGKIIQKGNNIAILSLGTRLQEAKKAGQSFKDKYNFDITIADARFAKPLDKEMILELAKKHKFLITIEEGSIGGFASHVNDLLINKDIEIKNLFYPDIFMDQGTQDSMHEKAKLNSEHIFKELSKYMKYK